MMATSREILFPEDASTLNSDIFALESDVVADTRQAKIETHAEANGSLLNLHDMSPGFDLGSPLPTDMTGGGAVSINSGGEIGPEVIVGTGGADEIHAGDNDNLIYGYGGDDTIFANGSADEVRGGSGYDYIKGGGGGDTLFAGPDGGSLWGDDGNDTLYAGDDGASLWGGANNDTLRGGEGRDTLYGDDGNDSLAGYMGRDTLDGGAGNDSLSGGVNADDLTGGSGSDQFWFLLGDTGNYTQGQADIISDFENADTIYIFAPESGLTDAGSTSTPGDSQYSIFHDSGIDAWIIRWNVGGYHDIVVHGDDPHGDLGWF
jgi:Ca2+-binding RTX toxin-like protein